MDRFSPSPLSGHQEVGIAGRGIARPGGLNAVGAGFIVIKFYIDVLPSLSEDDQVKKQTPRVDGSMETVERSREELWILALTGGDFVVTTLAILWLSAIMSALVDNIPFVATMIPMVEGMMPVFQSSVIPTERLTTIWWALAAGACLGGNGSLIAASANVIVAGIAEQNGVPIRFLPFLKIAFPIMLLQIAIATVYFWLRYL